MREKRSILEFVGALFILTATVVCGTLLWDDKPPQVHVAYAQTAYTTCDATRSQTTVSGSTSGTAAVKIVSLVAGDPIYVCSGFVVGTSGTTPTFSLVAGTGTNCASNQVTVIPPFATAANAPVIFPARLTAIAPAGYELCYLDGGTTPVQFYSFNYAQQ